MSCFDFVQRYLFLNNPCYFFKEISRFAQRRSLSLPKCPITVIVASASSATKPCALYIMNCALKKAVLRELFAYLFLFPFEILF